MNKTLRYSALALAFVVVLGGCSEKAALDSAQQSGATPPLPQARHFLLPPMQVPKGVGWGQDQAPKVAAGLKIEKIASGLKHPRQLYVLPNDDVLVVEANGPGTAPVTTPKALIAGLIMARSGKSAKGGNRITLLRKSSAGGEWDKHVLLEHLNSPFGVQVIGDALYVANTDAIVKFPFHVGDTRITAPGVQFADLPDTINHH